MAITFDGSVRFGVEEQHHQAGRGHVYNKFLDFGIRIGWSSVYITYYNPNFDAIISGGSLLKFRFPPPIGRPDSIEMRLRCNLCGRRARWRQLRLDVCAYTLAFLLDLVELERMGYEYKIVLHALRLRFDDGIASHCRRVLHTVRSTWPTPDAALRAQMPSVTPQLRDSAMYLYGLEL